MDGAVIAVFRVESEKLQARLAGSHAGIQKNRWYVKFSLELAFDGADAHERMQRFQVGDHVDVRVTNIDTKTRRLGLSIKAREIAEEKEAIDQYGSSDSGASLGDILGAALNKAKQEG